MTPVAERANLSAHADVTAITSSHRRLSFLDTVRGLAALAVVANHVGTSAFLRTIPIVLWRFNLGQFGVVAFFLVSGFIIPISMEKYGKLLPFWKARFFRLYPMYWVSLALLLLLVAVHPPHFASPLFHGRSLLIIAANATMIQRFAGFPDLLGVYWTLALELVFYVLCTILFWRKWLKHSFAVAIGAACGVALINNGFVFLLHHSPPAMHLSLLLSAFVGSVAYRVYSQEISVKYLNILFPVALVVVVEGFWLHYVYLLWPGEGHFRLDTMLLSWIAGYALFFLFFLFRARHFPRWLQWLGQISYSVYLLHELVSVVVPVTFAPWVYFALCTAITVGISHLTYRFVERPAIRLGRM